MTRQAEAASEIVQSILARGTSLICALLTEAFDSFRSNSDSLLFANGKSVLELMKKFEFLVDNSQEHICPCFIGQHYMQAECGPIYATKSGRAGVRATEGSCSL